MLVYYPERTPATIRNDLLGSATASWFDPRNGHTASAGSFKINESRVITPQSGWEDAGLILNLINSKD